MAQSLDEIKHICPIGVCEQMLIDGLAKRKGNLMINGKIKSIYDFNYRRCKPCEMFFPIDKLWKNGRCPCCHTATGKNPHDRTQRKFKRY